MPFGPADFWGGGGCMYLVEVLTSTRKCIFMRVVIGIQENIRSGNFMASGSHENNF